MAGFLAYATFTANDEDPELFLNQFERWRKYKNYTEKLASNSFPSPSKRWGISNVRCLHTYTKDSMHHITEQFKLHHLPKCFDLWKLSFEFWNMKQKKEQSLVDFTTVCQMVKKKNNSS